jgi:hypothetical protein
MQGNNTFPSKRKEIRGKLTRALLTNVEKYKTTVKEDEPIDDIEEFMKKMHEGSINAQKGKPQDNDFKKYVKKDIPAAFWGVNSELIFAGLCNDAGYSVKFDTPIGQHDYDFIVNEIPCQVKTILSTEKNIEEYTMKVNNMIAELRVGKKINEEKVKKEILNLLHENQEDIKKAIQQGGRIICVNGTHTYAGLPITRLILQYRALYKNLLTYYMKKTQ